MKKYSFILLFVFSFTIILSQNIFDLNNSDKYASHLFFIKDYKSASEEYKRLTKLAPDSIKYKLLFIKSLKFSNQYNLCSQEIENLFGENKDTYKNEIVNIYLQLLFYNKEFTKFDSLLNTKLHISEIEKKEYELALLLIKNDLKNAKCLINNSFINKQKQTKKLEQLFLIYKHLTKYRRKRPFVAVGLSAIIPGSGKIYANDTKNGIGVFSIIALNSWQSYRGFKNEGIKSFYGWAFGTLASGFYLANIYGAKKSAERENNFQKRTFNEKITNIICDF